MDYQELETFAKIALINYTPKSQMEMAEEECAEFIVAMRHFQRGREGANEAVLEEIADVIIMMAQMRQQFGALMVDSIIQRKINRELKRISDPDYSPERKQGVKTEDHDNRCR